jgi:flagellar biosynthesis/type III secretory pathway chaperone
MIGFHKQLWDQVRQEREALVQADHKVLQEITLAKRGLVETIRAHEEQRLGLILQLARCWRRPPEELSLSEIIATIQTREPRLADSLRSAQNALRVLAERVIQQNESNRQLVENSIRHVDAMKKNILGEVDPKAVGYDLHGQRGPGAQAGQARFLSREA